MGRNGKLDQHTAVQEGRGQEPPPARTHQNLQGPSMPVIYQAPASNQAPAPAVPHQVVGTTSGTARAPNNNLLETLDNPSPGPSGTTKGARGTPLKKGLADTQDDLEHTIVKILDNVFSKIERFEGYKQRIVILEDNIKVEKQRSQEERKKSEAKIAKLEETIKNKSKEDSSSDDNKDGWTSSEESESSLSDTERAPSRKRKSSSKDKKKK